MKTSTKDDVKRLAASIENLAHEIQQSIDNDADILATANELVRNNLILVFALGEVSASNALSKQVKGVVVKSGQTRYQNYHKARDNKGRFSRT